MLTRGGVGRSLVIEADGKRALKYAGGVAALRGVHLTIGLGELVAIVGPSGSGKSTLLHIAGTLDRPSTGSVSIADHNVADLPDRALSALRARHIGFVFQSFHLVPGVWARPGP